MSVASAYSKAVAPVLLGAAAFAMLGRLRYGVDLTDEAQYVGQAYASLIGGAPFQSDLFVQQVVSVALIPLLWVYTKVVGSSEGVVLFFRILWWAAALGGAVVFYRRFRATLGETNSALIALCLPLFAPFNIPSPSYNSFALLFLVGGLCVRAVGSRAPFANLGLAALSYPPFGVAFVGASVHALLRTPDRAALAKRLAVIAAIFCGIGVLAVAVFGPAHLRDALRFSSSFGTFGAGEKIELWRRQLPSLGKAFAFGSPLPNHYWVLALALGLLPFSLRKDAPVPRTLTALSVVCGFLSAWASSNGLDNGAIGIFPAFLAGLAALAARARSAGARAAIRILLLALALAMGVQAWRFVYRDAPVENLTAKVGWGPYRGLLTTPDRADFLDRIQRDVVALDDGKSSVFFFYNFPAGYLMSSLRPNTRMLFLHARPYSGALRNYVLPAPAAAGMPDWIVRVNGLPGFLPFDSGEPALDALVSPESEDYALIKSETLYTIHKKRM